MLNWHDRTLYRGSAATALSRCDSSSPGALSGAGQPSTPPRWTGSDEVLDRIDPAALQLYWTYASLNLVAAMIGEGRHTDVDLLLAIA